MNNVNCRINPLNAKLSPICHLLASLGAHHILHVSRIRVKLSQFNMSHQRLRTYSMKIVLVMTESTETSLIPALVI